MQANLKMSRFNQLQLIKILLYFVLNTGAHGRLTKFPPNSVVLKERSTVFTCCSDIEKTIFWDHKSVGSPDTDAINNLNGLVNGYGTSGRFNLTPSNSLACYNLVIKNVTRVDAGMYRCMDDTGLGHSKTWELTILETFDCQETNYKVEYMGVNDFGLPPDVISVVCISKYFGNEPPTPMYQWSSGKKLHGTYHRVTETRLTTTLSIYIPAMKEFNGDQLFCYVNGEYSNNQIQAAWNTSSLIINYASFHRKGVRVCTATELSLHCQPSCNYTAKRLSNGSSSCEITYSSNAHQNLHVFIPVDSHPGTTNIHNETNQAVESQTTLSGTTVAIIVLSSAVGILVIISTVLLILWCRKRRSLTTRGKTATESTETPETPVGASIHIGDGAKVTINTTPNMNSSRMIQNANPIGKNNNRTETTSFLDGDNMPATVVINMSEGEKRGTLPKAKRELI